MQSSRLAIVALFTLLAGCQDGVTTPERSLSPHASPTASTTEEYLDWNGNELTFYDDDGVYHRIVAH